MYKVEIAESAKKDIDRLPDQIRKRIKPKILSLQENPRPPGCSKLSGFGLAFYRIRVGDYRVVYHVNDRIKQVTITRVRHRKEVYR